MKAAAPPGSGKRRAAGPEPPAPTALARSGLDDALCYICKEYLTDPMTIACKHNFCRTCISRHLQGMKRSSCPQCGKEFNKKSIRSNEQLGRLAQYIQQKQELNPGQGRKEEGNVCAEHRKELAWYCKEEATYLCADCKGSPVHRSHAVIPIAKAAHQYKEGANTSNRCEDGDVQGQETISTQQQECGALASAHPLRKLLEEAVCLICKDYFNDPVSTDCGHNFCRVCITEHYEKREVEPKGVCCPQCRKKMKKEKFQTNKQLASMMENMQQLGKKIEILKKQIVCREHKDNIKRFCEDDGAVICLACDKAVEHGSHALVPIEEAAQKYKEKLHKDIELLKTAMEEISQLESKEQNKPNDWKERVKCHSQRILLEFEKLEWLLNEEKKRFRQRVGEEEMETLKKLNENVTKLSQKSFLLQQLITEIEEKCRQPAAELLRDVKGTLARSEQVRLQKLELVAAELKDAYRVPGLVEKLRQFTEKLQAELRWRIAQLYAVDVTLDPDTAHPKLVLSEDRKRVEHGDTSQDLPHSPERFDSYPIVLGAEGFPGGRHYWEVEVGDKTDWSLGVCRESVSRKGKGTLSSEYGYWTVWLRDGEYKASTSTKTPLPVSVRPSRVGIFLDYEAGEVSFYNVTDGSQLFTFTPTFSGTLRPYFCPGHNNWGDNVAPLIICPVPAQPEGISAPDSDTRSRDCPLQR